MLCAAVLMLSVLASAQTAPRAPVPTSSLPGAAGKVAAQATAAREANQVDQAVRLYQQALAQAPRWSEGWWYLGTLHYDASRYSPCRDAFQRFLALEPGGSPAYAMLGLCEFYLRDFAAALGHLERARTIGLPSDQELTASAMYHEALLQTKFGNFETALKLCGVLSRREPDSPRLIAAAGVAALRRQIFPHELPDSDRDLAFRLGGCFVVGGERPAEEAARRFEALVRDYPNTPNVHYSYSMFLLANDPERGLTELRLELAIDPNHVPALISTVFELMKRGQAAEALPLAERAVSAAPNNFVTHASLGRVLLDLDQVPRAIAELETAARLESTSPQVFLSLASAYSRAGRKVDADRARARFTKLKSSGAATANP